VFLKREKLFILYNQAKRYHYFCNTMAICIIEIKGSSSFPLTVKKCLDKQDFQGLKRIAGEESRFICKSQELSANGRKEVHPALNQDRRKNCLGEVCLRHICAS
jgi:hypothetical protein